MLGIDWGQKLSRAQGTLARASQEAGTSFPVPPLWEGEARIDSFAGKLWGLTDRELVEIRKSLM
jgi:hypothetical protein